MQKSHGGAEVGVVAVDVVDEDGARDVHLLGCLPQLGRHDLRAIDGVNHEHGHLGGVHRGDRIADEVGVTRGVEQVDFVVLVMNSSNGRADGELAPDLFVVVIEIGLAVVGRAHAGRATGDEQHRLSERSLAGAILADKRDVAHMFRSRCSHTNHHLSSKGIPPIYTHLNSVSNQSKTSLGSAIKRLSFFHFVTRIAG